MKTLDWLRQQGKSRRESIVYWLGKLIDDTAAVITSYYNPKQTTSAIMSEVDAIETARLIFRIHKRGEILYSQIHSHPGSAFHSTTDDLYPVIHEPGLISIVVANYGFIRPDDFFTSSSFHEYIEQGKWKTLTKDEARKRLVILPKSFEHELFDRTRILIEDLKLPSSRALTSFKETKIAISIDKGLIYMHRGQHLLLALINLLLRLNLSLDVFLPQLDVELLASIPNSWSNKLSTVIERLSLKINPFGRLRINPIPQTEYDILISIGRDELVRAKHYLHTEGFGWVCCIGNHSIRSFDGDSSNPVGSLLAAGYCSAEVFKRILAARFSSKFESEFVEQLTVSALDYKINETVLKNPPFPEEINLGEIVLQGAGAVGMSVAYALASLPAVTGRLKLIDPEKVDITNLGRYTLADITDVGIAKVEVIKQKLSGKLNVEPFEESYQEYPSRTELDLVVTTVDNLEARQAVQQDSPQVILNAGMYGAEFTISRHESNMPFSLNDLYPKYTLDLELRRVRKYPAAPFVSMTCGALLAGEILKERVQDLKKYRLNNTLMVSSMLSPPSTGRTWHVMVLKSTK